MNRRWGKRVLAGCMAMALLLPAAAPFLSYAKEALPDIQIEDVTEEEPMEVSEQSEDTDLCYISAFAVDEAIDGTAPFDANDEPGNDSADDNGIVRSFDTVNYTLKYTTAIRDQSVSGIDSADVMIKFVLPCDPSVAVFCEENMQWCLDRKVTYVYADGSYSTTWDMDRTVVRQILTGRRQLVNNESGNTIPGTGTLSVGVSVKMASAGSVIAPSFSIWMDGNGEKDVWTVENEVVVSAAPKYDLQISRNANCNILGYYNFTDGTVSSNPVSDDDVYGRLQGYGIALSLRNDTSAKGLKGIEIPQGTITFDLRMAEVCDGEDVSDDPDYDPYLWDYKMNSASSVSTKGTLGRTMAPLGQESSAGTSWQTNLPYNNRGSALYCCYDGGTMAVTQDLFDDNLLHVTLTGYAFDRKNMQFPDRDNSDRGTTIAANVGYFSVGYLQMLAPFPRDVDEIENITVTLTGSDFRATSLSGDTVTSEVLTSNNRNQTTITTYPQGSHSKRSFFYAQNGAQLASFWSLGDSYTYAGSTVRLTGHMTYTGDNYLSGTNILQKFDDEALEVPAGTNRFTSYSRSNSLTKVGTIHTLFAAKPDKTGWSSDQEMNDTREEDLIYFASIDDLNAAGYTCVGILWEVRDSKLYPNNSGGCISIYNLLHVKEDTPSGTVAMTKNDVRSFSAEQPNDFSWLDVPYEGVPGAYGVGGTQEAYVDGYATPRYVTYLNYAKSIYENGAMVGGHTNGYQGGNSLLIISNKVGVDITVADRTGEDIKSVYDLDAGERTASFSVQPSLIIDSANDDIYDSDAMDTLHVTITLPDGLHFNDTGVSMTPSSVEVRSDGTTVVTWTLADVPVREALDPIVFSVTIGEEGTPQDVSNNDWFLVSASATSENDVRPTLAANGNYDETQISVIKLAASAVTKRAMTPLTEQDGEIQYRLRYSNLSNADAKNVVLYDILPYVGDGRGSDFSGSYVVSKVEIDYSHADRYDWGWLYLTTDASGRTAAAEEKALSYDLSDMDPDMTGTAVTGRETFTPNLPATALAVDLRTVYGNTYIDVYITLQPTGNKPEDVYANRFTQFADRQAAVVTSNVVTSSVVSRAISGQVWIDSDQDGMYEADTDRLFAGAEVSLLYLENGDSGVYSSAYDIYGERIPDVTTGADGSYRFTNLHPGTYMVVVNGVSAYSLTVKNAGEDDTVDSDADGSYQTNQAQLDYAYIQGIDLPDLANMTGAVYESAHWDVGLVEVPAKLQITKTSDLPQDLSGLAGYSLEGAVFGVYTDAACTDEVLRLTTDADGVTEVKDLPVTKAAETTYYIKELTAPAGHALSTEVKALAVSFPEDVNRTFSVEIADKPLFADLGVLVKKTDGRGNPLAGALFTAVYDDGAGHSRTWLLLSDANGEVRLDEDYLQEGSDALYVYDGAPVVPYGGTLTLTETRAPAGYVSHGEPFVWETDADALVTKTAVNAARSGSLTIEKLDGNGDPLAGVTFALTYTASAAADGGVTPEEYLLSVGDTIEATTDVNGRAVWENLEPGTYLVTETAAPAGTQLLAKPFTVTIPVTMTREEAINAGADLSAGLIDGDTVCFYDLTYTVTDDAVLDLPMSGAYGAGLFAALGGALLFVSIVIVICEKKRRKKRKVLR